MQKISRTKTAGRIRQLLREKGITARKVQEALELESTQAVYRWTHGHTLSFLRERSDAVASFWSFLWRSFWFWKTAESASRRILRMNLENNSSLVEIVGTKNSRAFGRSGWNILLSDLDSFPRDVSACGI